VTQLHLEGGVLPVCAILAMREQLTLQPSGVTQLVSDALGLVVHKQNLGN
jgi:hypothetical protein